MAKLIIQKGGIAGGYMDCDGKKHRWIYAEWEKHGLPQIVPMGWCEDPERCKQKAALLIQQEKEEAERLAKAMAEMQAKQKKPAAPPVQTTSPAPMKEG